MFQDMEIVQVEGYIDFIGKGCPLPCHQSYGENTCSH